MAHQTITSSGKPSLPIAQLSNLRSTRRLLVLILNPELDSTYTAQRVWKLATATNSLVQLIGLFTEKASQSSLQRKLISISALLQNSGVTSEIKIQAGANWVETIAQSYKENDTILFITEHRTGASNRNLRLLLKSNLETPIYVLFNHPYNASNTNWLSTIIAWTVLLSIILGMGILQANIIQLHSGWLQSLLLIGSTLIEFWLILTLNDQLS